MKPGFRTLCNALLTACLLGAAVFQSGLAAGSRLHAAAATSPVYFEIALDQGRGWIYGSDSAGNKIDVISSTTLELVKSFTLVNGSGPKGLALSPDGAELAVAQSGASSILFLNPDTGAVIATIIPTGTTGANMPWDVIYGRAGRLYSTGNPGSGGFDYIHMIDTASHTEIGKSSYIIRSAPRLALSADGNFLYTSDANFSPQNLYKFDVSTDVIGSPYYVFGAGFFAASFILDPDENLIFTDKAQVWTADARTKVGSTGVAGQVAYIPEQHAVAITTSTSVVFASAQNFNVLSTYALPVSGVTVGPIAAQSDGSKVYVSTSSGIVAVDLSAFPPGIPATLPIGSLPYSDLVSDEADGVLYGSNTNGNKIDVISMSSLQVIDEIRLNNGAKPLGMDLSPDGSELAVALNGASSIAFIDTTTHTISATAMVFTNSMDLPYDAIYGRAGRLYSSGNPSSGGYDYIHVIDTAAHSEIAKSSYIIRSAPRLAMSADGNVLYVNEHFSPNNLYKFDVSTDTISSPAGSPCCSLQVSDFILLADDSKLFTDYGQVWDSSLSAQIGSFNAAGYLAETPSLNAVAVISKSTPGLITFVSRADYYTLGSVTLPGISTAGPAALAPAAEKLYVSTDKGLRSVTVSLSDPVSIAISAGTPQTTLTSHAFANPLQVQVRNILGNALAGSRVTFSAPSSGASGVFGDSLTNTTVATTDANGIATSSPLTANTLVGNFAVTAQASGLASSVAFQMTNLTARPIISGNVDVSGVTLSYDDGTPKTVSSDAAGNYFFDVPSGWSGTVLPSKPNYTFLPASKTYSKVIADQALQDYTALPTRFMLSGNVGLAGATVSYYDGAWRAVYSDASGSYSLDIPAGWSGTVTPSKVGYVFMPDHRDYSNLVSNQAGQDYTPRLLVTVSYQSQAANDGWVLESSETSDIGGRMNSNATTFLLGDDAQDRQYRSILSFATGALPDTAIITNVNLKIKRQALTGTDPFQTHGNILVDIRNGAFGTSALQLADFQATASQNAAATIRNSTSVDGWYETGLLATAYTDVNKLGVTQFRLRFATDDNDDRSADYLAFYSGDFTKTTSYRPVLEIQYYVP